MVHPSDGAEMTIKPITCRIDCLDAMRNARILIASATDDESGLSKLQRALEYLIDAKACLEAAIDLHKETQ